MKTLFLRFMYRPLMKLAHRFNWHYAPIHGPIAPTGEYQRWCQWCGLRQSFSTFGGALNPIAYDENGLDRPKTEGISPA